MLNCSSQITFMYFDRYDEAKRFFTNILELETVYEPEWACVYRVSEGAFIGAVDATRGSVEYPNKGGMLISLTVSNIEKHYLRLKNRVENITEIKELSDIGLKSFFFKGPEDYDFEIQEFLRDDLIKLF